MNLPNSRLNILEERVRRNEGSAFDVFAGFAVMVIMLWIITATFTVTCSVVEGHPEIAAEAEIMWPYTYCTGEDPEEATP